MNFQTLFVTALKMCKTYNLRFENKLVYQTSMIYFNNVIGYLS